MVSQAVISEGMFMLTARRCSWRWWEEEEEMDPPWLSANNARSFASSSCRCRTLAPTWKAQDVSNPLMDCNGILTN